jgi:hypothetical protein
MKATAKQAGNRRDRRGGREPEDEEDDDFDQLVRTWLRGCLSCVPPDVRLSPGPHAGL